MNLRDMLECDGPIFNWVAHKIDNIAEKFKSKGE